MLTLRSIVFGTVGAAAALTCSPSDAQACHRIKHRARVTYYPVQCYYYYPQQQGPGQDGITSLQNLPAPDVSEIHAADNLPKPKSVDEIMSNLKAKAAQAAGAGKP